MLADAAQTLGLVPPLPRLSLAERRATPHMRHWRIQTVLAGHIPNPYHISSAKVGQSAFHAYPCPLFLTVAATFVHRHPELPEVSSQTLIARAQFRGCGRARAPR